MLWYYQLGCQKRSFSGSMVINFVYIDWFIFFSCSITDSSVNEFHPLHWYFRVALLVCTSGWFFTCLILSTHPLHWFLPETSIFCVLPALGSHLSVQRWSLAVQSLDSKLSRWSAVAFTQKKNPRLFDKSEQSTLFFVNEQAPEVEFVDIWFQATAFTFLFSSVSLDQLIHLTIKWLINQSKLILVTCSN